MQAHETETGPGFSICFSRSSSFHAAEVQPSGHINHNDNSDADEIDDERVGERLHVKHVFPF